MSKPCRRATDSFPPEPGLRLVPPPMPEEWPVLADPYWRQDASVAALERAVLAQARERRVFGALVRSDV